MQVQGPARRRVGASPTSRIAPRDHRPATDVHEWPLSVCRKTSGDLYDSSAAFVSVSRKARTPENSPCIRSTWSASTENSSSRSSRSARPSLLTVARHPDVVPASVSATPIVAPDWRDRRARSRVFEHDLALNDLIHGRWRADVEEHRACLQRHFRRDGGQREQLCR